MNPIRKPPTPSRQRGVALVVVLMLLLIMTLLGLASLRGAILEERMSANMFDRSLSFQATEAALREAELLVLATPQATFNAAPAICANGICPTPTVATVANAVWLDNTAGTWRTATSAIPSATGLTAQPQFKIEYMGEGFPAWVGCDQGSKIPPGCLTRRFRITARSASSVGDRAYVMLQSNFKAP